MSLVKDVASFPGRAAQGAFELWGTAVTKTVLFSADLALQAWSRVPLPPDLQPFFRSALEEYRQDLRELSKKTRMPELLPLARLTLRALVPGADGEAKKPLDRLTASMLVKARHGAIRFAEPDAVPVAPTPRTRVHETPRLDLYRYERRGKGKAGAAPVLLVCSLINRSYVLDLMKGHSFVQHLLDQGLDVYIVEWKEEKRSDRTATFDGFVGEELPECVDAVRRLSRAPRVSLLGHCMGGVFATAAAALAPETVERLVLLTTPFTVAEGGIVALWTKRRVYPAETIIDSLGVMPGKAIRLGFVMLKPYGELMRWRLFVDTLANEAAHPWFDAGDRWLNDNPDVPGEVFRTFVREVYQGDRFLSGRTEVGGRRVDLSRITCPVLNLAGDADWVVPAASVAVAHDKLGSVDYRFGTIPGGHVALLFDPRNRERWSEISGFLLEKAKAPKRVPRTRRTR